MVAKAPMALGTGEIILLVFILVVVFSASRMGALGNSLGKFVYSFRKAARGEGFVDAKADPQRRLSRPPPEEDATVIDDGPGRPKS